MEDKIVPINRAKEKRQSNDSRLMLSFSRDISRIENLEAKECLLEAWRKASIIIFSAPSLPD
jgi:hypothetical protein